jgi:FlaA1/EpsC-like NDP-sugar epimerase
MSCKNVPTCTEEYRNYPLLGKNQLKNFNDISFSTNLLDRDTTPIYSSKAKKHIRDKVILITGAGGSIGSEIVRQVSQLNAKKIYCLDNDEYSLYNLSLELHGDALLTDEDKRSISIIFNQTKPDIVYHAAAHKHLPLLERSPIEAINTNVFGTDNIASTCVEYGVKYFVNISTDKAARPVSVLGMTKRLAELCTAGYNGGRTKVASVRFGNVLGSRGSFLQTLIWQIENEKPVKVTDPEVSRFFMTIPEAVALVIEASSLASNGETYVLDMGTSVKIVDLIERFVRITGCKSPEIVFTGLRNGEKLQEELFGPSEINSKTAHSRITKINSEQFEIITNYDKMDLKSMINLEISTEELRRRLAEFLYSIESRKEYIKRKQKLISIKV